MQSLLSPDDALRHVVERTPSPSPTATPLAEALFHILARDVSADEDYPPFERAMMDGYAVRAADAGKTVIVTGEAAAGVASRGPLAAGAAVEIMTGAPCPPGADAVVPKEDVRRNGGTVTLPATIRPGQNITPKGSECAAGSLPLRAGDVVTPLAIAVLATFGLERVPVYRFPSVAIITTGNELVPLNQRPGPAQIRNSNGPMLAAMARMAHIRDVSIRHANDSIEAFSSALEKAREKDIVILSGAVSEGRYDLVPQALARYGAAAVFHRVSQRPGKPILFATKETQLIFALPGNPLSCHLGFHRYVNAAIRKWTGRPPQVEQRSGILGAPVAIRGPRTVFQLARVHVEDGVNRVMPLVGKGSADIYAACRANAMVRFEPESREIPAGTPVLYEPIIPCHA